jgi:hypothetical protein
MRFKLAAGEANCSRAYSRLLLASNVVAASACEGFQEKISGRQEGEVTR